MKILFITRGFPSEKDPMAGNYEAVQIKAIAAKGHEVSVIAVRWLNLLHFFRSKKVSCRSVDGIPIYECDRLTLSIPHIYFPKIELLFRKWQFKRIFNRYVKELGMPDVVHAHIVMYAAPAIFLKEELNLPFVITEHWSRIFEENTLKRVMNQTFVYHQVDKVICVSNALSNNLQQKCSVDSVVIHNMVSNRFFRFPKSVHQDGSFRFIAVGAMREVKRFDLLVEAFALCHFPKNVSLAIVGDGEKRRLVEKKIEECDVSRQVKLFGMRTPEEVNNLLCQSDCFVLSSKLETFSIVLIEAMAKGLPVIATRCGGPETFVRPEDGILVPKENAEELANAMKKMIEHYLEYNGEEIRQHCHDNFSQDVIADKIISVYQSIIDKSKHVNDELQEYNKRDM